MNCSNCLEDRGDTFLVCESRKYYACPRCSVTYAKNREGTAFLVDEDVQVKQGFNSKLDGRILTIIGIYIFEECESGRMIWMRDKETQKNLKIIVDTNWLIKLKN